MPRRFPWARASDEELLGLRIRSLGLRLEGTPLEPSVARLHDELDQRGLRFRPHVWLSSEWFSPDGVPGIAVPFYLAHPRLRRLERRQMLQVEGATDVTCMRILRHEAGHAIGTAYRLHFKPGWREVFGRYSQRYPRYYRPKPGSREHVLHLDAWYAQAHPAEDFAETFAVWLTPGSNWRRRYADWPVALGKLQFVDNLMREIAGDAPRNRARTTVEPVSGIRQTLAEHYRRKRQIYGATWPDIYDRDLLRVFAGDGAPNRRPPASSFLRGIRVELRDHVARGTGAHPYTIDQVLQDMIERCRELKLRLAVPRHVARAQAIVLLTMHTMNCLRGRRHEIPV